MRVLAGLTMGLAVVGCAPGPAQPEHRAVPFDNEQSLGEMTVEGGASIDATKDRTGEAGGALKVEPGGIVRWPLRDANGAGTVEMWIYDDGSAPPDPKQHGAGPMWGLMQEEGPMLAVGAVYAPYLSGDKTYATSQFDPTKDERPWWEVQYLGLQRDPAWHKWTFEFDPDEGLRILYDDQDINERRQVFNWSRTALLGFTGVVLFGDATPAQQTLWVDDIAVTLGGPVNTRPIWPPPPPASLAPRPPAPDHTPTPYDRWPNGPSADADYFPIAVWLQDPKNAERYKEAGFNLYIGLWQGPTEAQLAALTAAAMPVICDQNEVGLAHLDGKIIVGWMHGDEPDNAQALPEGGGYGPPILPEKIVEDYQRVAAADPSRPVMLNLGQGVAWDAWHGRGVRTNHPEDYPEYAEGCDIVSFDIYPVVHRHADVAGRLWYVPLGVSRLREWTGDEKIVWNCIECSRIGNPNVKPTPEQIRAEVWMSIIFGSRGLIYFVHQFEPDFVEASLLEDEDLRPAVTAINQQIHGLAAVINSPTVTDGATVESSAEIVPVRFAVKKHGDATYLFAVSMFHEETTARFHVAGLPPKAAAEVLGEDRALDVTDGSFEDHFAGYDVHLYRIR
jgi:hypothetical protein